MVMIIFLAILAIFLVLSRRKLAYFTLAIFAGVVLNQYFNAEVVKFFELLKLNISSAVLAGIASLVIILTPAILLLPKNPKQEKWIFGIISSIFTSIFVLTFAQGALSRIFIFDEISRNIALHLADYAGLISLTAVILSILSILSFKFEKPDKKS